VAGLAFSAGTVIGGLVADALPSRPAVLGHRLTALQVLFLTSSVLRFAAAGLGTRIARATGAP
jgi:hypothetical protein